MVATASPTTKRPSGPAKSSRNAPSPPSRESCEPDNGIREVDSEGDLVLDLEHEGVSQKFRVDAAILQSRSKYFTGLLAGHFGESERLERQHKDLRERYGAVKSAPSEMLPVVHIEDIGRISAVKSIAPLCTDFLNILHGRDFQTLPPVANLANLATVADRFDALEHVKLYVRQKKILRGIDGKATPKAEAALTEEKVRQRLLLGILLEYAPWVEKYSARMIIKGWVGKEPEASATALWWDLPSRVEDELAFRRDCVLETIQSLQTHFIDLYISRERQCKLGYDSSDQCDSFQLGQIIRFFTRIGTVRVHGTLLVDVEPEDDNATLRPAATGALDGDLNVLLDSLRQVSEYQIDRNHTHCGIRTRIIPLLDLLAVCLTHIGICGECWSEDRFAHAWIEARRPLIWKKEGFRLLREHSSSQQHHREWHGAVRAVFTATGKDWS